MKPEKAWDIIRKKYPGQKLIACLQFKGFYVFSIEPITKGSGTYATGRIFPAVDMKTGRVFNYDITSDIDAYEAAEQVNVTTILERTLEYAG